MKRSYKKIEEWVECPACLGSGTLPPVYCSYDSSELDITCTHCDGSGEVKKTRKVEDEDNN